MVWRRVCAVNTPVDPFQPWISQMVTGVYRQNLAYHRLHQYRMREEWTEHGLWKDVVKTTPRVAVFLQNFVWHKSDEDRQRHLQLPGNRMLGINGYGNLQIFTFDQTVIARLTDRFTKVEKWAYFPEDAIIAVHVSHDGQHLDRIIAPCVESLFKGCPSGEVRRDDLG